MAPQTDTPGTARARRFRRVLATTAAAAVVVLVPTACDYAIASDRFQSGGAAPAQGQTGSTQNVSQTRPQQAPEPDSNEQGATDQGRDPQGAQGQQGAEDQEGAAEETESAAPTTSEAPATSESAAASESEAPAEEEEQPAQENNGLDVLARDCSGSQLPEHTGFQVAPACVDTAFGEVSGEDQNPSLLITDAPTEVKVGEAFDLQVSTRNLVRDRFLGAAAGGYYLESSVLNGEGIQRGHFHTACRMLDTTDAAPDAAPAPDFFLATQDNQGGAGESSVTVPVTGLKSAGLAQCAVWAGDGSHRIPMMQRANQTPAFDVVRIKVV
ncbi:Pecanex-like protein 1 [Pseudonocardia pini]|uniref:Pecanex-like protein 1 n=1 Tax=Pseudonocardia pini TaxID=2758030 RepID=UPI0015F01094|nr:Pecanex-like protein 1 [Pseudonocardia pini]